MSNQFCRMLSNGYKINVSGNDLLWSPCCFYKTKTILGSEEFKREIQYTSQATDWLPECIDCQIMESTGVEHLSPRINSFKRIPNDLPDGACGDLEISFDTSCNAACLSCGPYASTTWEKLNKKHVLKLTNSDDNQGHIERVDNYYQSLISNVDLSQVNHVFMMGGEPLYSDTSRKLISHLESVDDVSKIVVSYQTNGSIFPDADILEKLSKFRAVIFNLSIDGVGDRFEYLRWPLQWDTVNANVQRLVAETKFMFAFTCTVSPLNVLYWQEIVDWVEKTIPADRIRKMPRVNRCQGTMDLARTSKEFRQEIVDHYGPDHAVSKVVNSLEYMGGMEGMISYLESQDLIRKNSWRGMFPAFEEAYERNFL